MNERTRPMLLEFDASMESDLLDMLADLRIAVEPAPQAKNFGGDGQLIAFFAEVAREAEPVLAGAIAALAVVRRGKSVKIDGFEVRGMSVREIISLLEAFRAHDVDRSD